MALVKLMKIILFLVENKKKKITQKPKIQHSPENLSSIYFYIMRNSKFLLALL